MRCLLLVLLVLCGAAVSDAQDRSLSTPPDTSRAIVDTSKAAGVDTVVADVWREGYSHHITRLMVLANLATLLGEMGRPGEAADVLDAFVARATPRIRRSWCCRPRRWRRLSRQRSPSIPARSTRPRPTSSTRRAGPPASRSCAPSIGSSTWWTRRRASCGSPRSSSHGVLDAAGRRRRARRPGLRRFR